MVLPRLPFIRKDSSVISRRFRLLRSRSGIGGDLLDQGGELLIPRCRQLALEPPQPVRVPVAEVYEQRTEAAGVQGDPGVQREFELSHAPPLASAADLPRL